MKRDTIRETARERKRARKRAFTAVEKRVETTIGRQIFCASKIAFTHSAKLEKKKQ